MSTEKICLWIDEQLNRLSRGAALGLIERAINDTIKAQNHLNQAGAHNEAEDLDEAIVALKHRRNKIEQLITACNLQS